MNLTAVKDGRDGLIAATLRVLDRAGIEAVTLRAVGQEAGVSAPAVYWHFDGKDGLMAEALKEIAALFIRRIRQAAAGRPISERLAAVSDAFIDS